MTAVGTALWHADPLFYNFRFFGSFNFLFASLLGLVLVAAVIIGAAAVVLGLLISYHAEAAPGATMALTAVTFFLLALVERSLRATIRTRYLGPVRSVL